MKYKYYNLEELQEKSEELDKIMKAIADKLGMLSDANEEINNVQLEEEIYQQMNQVKLEDLDAIT